MFIKSNVFLLSNLRNFCKIIGFTKQIYENKSLSQNHVERCCFQIFRFLYFQLLYFIFNKSSKRARVGEEYMEMDACVNSDSLELE